MTRLEWCRQNAPAALIGVSDDELINSMKEAYKLHVMEQIVPCDATISDTDKWLIVKQIPNSLEDIKLYIKLIDKGIDPRSVWDVLDTFDHETRKLLPRAVEFSSCGITLSLAIDITGKYKYSNYEAVASSIKLGLDWSSLDPQKVVKTSLDSAVTLLSMNKWDDRLLPYLYEYHSKDSLEAVLKLYESDEDLSWLYAPLTAGTVRELLNIIDKTGTIPDCLKKKNINEDFIYFFKKYGYSGEIRDIIGSMNDCHFCELAIMYPNCIDSIKRYDSKLCDSVMAYICGYYHNLTPAEFWAIDYPLQKKCERLAESIDKLYSRFGVNTLDELIEVLHPEKFTYVRR